MDGSLIAGIITAAVTLLLAGTGGAIGYGFLKGRVAALEQRQKNTEEATNRRMDAMEEAWNRRMEDVIHEERLWRNEHNETSHNTLSAMQGDIREILQSQARTETRLDGVDARLDRLEKRVLNGG